jgi:hypothetical protein
MRFLKERHKYMAPEGENEGGGGDKVVEPVVETVVEPVVELEGKPSEKEKVVEKPTVEKVEDDVSEEKPAKSRLSQVSGLVEQSGLDMKEVAEYAKANSGEVDLDTMVALKDKHGEGVASLIADQIKSLHKTSLEKASARDNEVYKQVEGLQRRY